MREADKLALVGKLAAEIAYEIRNPLISRPTLTDIENIMDYQDEWNNVMRIMK